MPSTSSQTLKLKSTLRLLIPRLRSAQKKDTARSIASRREMSVLLSQSREASARIRVENIIQTDICVELMEILELYAELLLARAGLLEAREKERKSSGGGGMIGDDDAGGGDTGLEEAAASIIYEAPRLPREVRELGIVRGLLVDRFGKEFALRCSVDGGGGVVPRRVVEKLRVEPPGKELVEAYLREIARTYGVEWPRGGEREEGEREREMGVLEGEIEEEARPGQEEGGGTDDDGDNGRSGGNISTPIKPKPKSKPSSHLGRAFSPEDLTRVTPPRDLGPRGAKSPISVAPPAPRSDNPAPTVKLPGGEEVKKADSQPPVAKNVVVGGKIPNVDELAKRFALLKR